MARIGEILIADGHLTQEGLDEALDWQVLYGGRLGTNLLELKLVEEEHLAHALGKQMGAEVAWGEIDVDANMIGVIPRHIADRQEIIPWKLDKRRLKILCCQIDVAAFDQLSTKVGRSCVPVIAPEFRIFQLLRAHYQAQRQMRALDFGVVPEEGRSERKKKKAKAAGEVVEEAPELIDEGAFNDIYAQVVAGRSAAPPAQAQPPQQQWAPPQSWPPGYGPQVSPTQPPPGWPPGYPWPPPGYVMPAQQAAPVQPAPSWQPPPPPAPPQPPVMTPVQPPAPHAPVARSRTAKKVTQITPEPEPPAEAPVEALPEDAILEELPADAIMGEPAALEEEPAMPATGGARMRGALAEEPAMPATGGARMRGALEEAPVEARAAEADEAAAEIEAEAPIPTVTWDEPSPIEEPRRDESPLDFKQALKALEGVSDRDSIAHIVLRASRSKAARALLLQVQGGVALGWDGLGEGLENGAATQVALPLRVDSAFSLVAKTRSHYMGPLQKTQANIRFLATLGKKVPLSSLI
ncbi:MAG TPA: hypothetical protein VLW85_09690, partial [Myxococcales bacterium]|nr:hypothetical protein [Myxococcales bacterium]